MTSTNESIVVRSGGAVTISTTGGGAAGTGNLGIVVGSDTYRNAANAAIIPVTGAVIITDTNSFSPTLNGDDVSVYGGKTVPITTTADAGTTNGIHVGLQGTKADDPTGNVTIVNQTTLSTGKFYWGAAADVVGVNGATAVTLTGGGTGGSVQDDAATATLTTVNLTSVGGTQTLTGNAITNVNVTNSNTKDNAGVSQTATAVVVNNTTAAHTLNIGLSGDTGTTITDSVAKTIAVTQTGGASTVSLADTLGSKLTFTFANSGTGTLTLGTDISALASGTTGEVITVSGTGNVALGTQDGGVQLASITSTSSGTLSATIKANYDASAGTAINFTGGSGATTLTLDAGTTAANGIKGQINGGTSGNNTLIFTNVAADYVFNTPLNGSILQNFQNSAAVGHQHRQHLLRRQLQHSGRVQSG